MHPGLKQSDAWQQMQEMLPVVRALWQGDVKHDGKFWKFPASTSCPKPLQSDVPVWVAARSPITFDYALREKCHVMSWPLTRGFSEAELYKQQLDAAIVKADNGFKPTF
jgi:alkanesulfonate monooxygenase SsuD/methylene tetrahydromethanopterin reductase-like flavin-dependent oxidoreductase (luciferase family)